MAKKKKTPDPLLPSSISFVVGPLGSGKSYFAMRYIMKYLSAGKIVACNFDLRGAWWKTLANRTFHRKWNMDDAQRYAWAQDCKTRCYRFDIQDDLYEYRLPGTGEDRGLLVLDEAGLQMNTRMYARRQSKDKAKYGEDNALKSLEFYINMRKKGWASLVLAHSESHVDSQLRDMGGQIIKLRNLARIKIPFTPFKMARKPRFVAIHKVPDTKPPMVHKREIYGLDLPTANHYESMQEFDASPEIGQGIRLHVPSVKLARPVPVPLNTWDSLAARTRRPPTDVYEGEGGADAPPAKAGLFTGSPGSWRDTRKGK